MYIYVFLQQVCVLLMWMALSKKLKNELKHSSDCWSRNLQNAQELQSSVSSLSIFLKYISKLIMLNELYFVA